MPIANLPWKFHANPCRSFCIKLLTNRQTERQTDNNENISSLAEVTNTNRGMLHKRIVLLNQTAAAVTTYLVVFIHNWTHQQFTATFGFQQLDLVQNPLNGRRWYFQRELQDDKCIKRTVFVAYIGIDGVCIRKGNLFNAGRRFLPPLIILSWHSSKLLHSMFHQDAKVAWHWNLATNKTDWLELHSQHCQFTTLLEKLNFRRSYFTRDFSSLISLPLVTWTLDLYNVGATSGWYFPLSYMLLSYPLLYVYNVGLVDCVDTTNCCTWPSSYFCTHTRTRPATYHQYTRDSFYFAVYVSLRLRASVNDLLILLVLWFCDQISHYVLLYVRMHSM